jgi:hemerythrin-like domain-containing protein
LPGGCATRRLPRVPAASAWLAVPLMCSYCGCRNIPMIAKLNAEHDAIVNASHRLQTALGDGDPDLAREGANEVSMLLHPHTAREELGVFAELKLDTMFTAHIESLCAEHDELDRLLEGISQGRLTLITETLTLLNNHINREENGLFPAALAYLDDEQWDRIHRPALMHSHPGEV